MFPMSSLLESRNCVLHLRTVLDLQRFQNKVKKLRLDAISIPDYVIKKGATHGARHGKTEVQRKYHMAWNAWKRCCKKVDSQGELLQVFTIDFSEIQFIVNYNSKSDGQNKSAKSGMNLHKKTMHTNSLPEEQEKIQRTMVSYFEQSRQKWACEASI